MASEERVCELRIKNPAKHTDHSLRVPPSVTLERLRALIQANVEGNPPPETQTVRARACFAAGALQADPRRRSASRRADTVCSAAARAPRRPCQTPAPRACPPPPRAAHLWRARPEGHGHAPGGHPPKGEPAHRTAPHRTAARTPAHCARRAPRQGAARRAGGPRRWPPAPPLAAGARAAPRAARPAGTWRAARARGQRACVPTRLSARRPATFTTLMPLSPPALPYQ